MKRVIHLLDDMALGGVTRLLDSLMTSLAVDYDHERRVMETRGRLAPALDADLIVVHFTLAWSKLPFLLLLRLRNPRTRVILVEHTYTASFETTCVKRRWRFRLLLRLVYGLVNHVIAVSQGQARWILGAHLARTEHVTVVPCILDLAPFAALPPPVGRAGPMRLGAFGRFHRQKAFDTLIEAMRQVAPAEAQLELAGYGEDEGQLRRAAANLPHVHVIGRVDPVAFISQADVVVIPSRWEAGAVTCWEVRASARPIIVSSVDGLPEQVSLETGLVVPADDPSSLAQAIRQLAAIDRGSMGDAARRSTDGAFERTVEAWRMLLKRYCNVTTPRQLTFA